MSPGQYARLRRLNRVRAALRNAATTSVESIAKQYGISNYSQFAEAYKTVFGEAPLTTLPLVMAEIA